jgi:hypothetical protein
VAVPNVTAIDWKQADVYGPGIDQQGGKSFTVKRLVPPFFLVSFNCPLHVSVLSGRFIARTLLKQRVDETPAT